MYQIPPSMAVSKIVSDQTTAMLRVRVGLYNYGNPPNLAVDPCEKSNSDKG